MRVPTTGLLPHTLFLLTLTLYYCTGSGPIQTKRYTLDTRKPYLNTLKWTSFWSESYLRVNPSLTVTKSPIPSLGWILSSDLEVVYPILTQWVILKLEVVYRVLGWSYTAEKSHSAKKPYFVVSYYIGVNLSWSLLYLGVNVIDWDILLP